MMLLDTQMVISATLDVAKLPAAARQRTANASAV
jgi:hypothetical protein